MAIPDHDRLAHMADAWSAAATRWDPAALASLYTPDAMLFGGRPGHSVGGAGIRDYFDSYAGVILSASLTLIDQHIARTGDTSLFAQGFCAFAFELIGNRHTRSDLRTTWLLDWSEGATRIRAHHFSPVPATPPLGN